LQFFPELVEQKHLFILQTPLFRVRNKQVTKYCYDEVERDKAAKEIGKTGLEITRFKGLGEISPEEFGQFIGEDMRLETVVLPPDASFGKMLAYYMGNNTPQRQDHIVQNLRAEAVEDAFRYGRMVVAACSYDAGLFTPAYDFLHSLQMKGWQKRRAAVIENGSWAPSAGRVMTEMLSAMKEVTLVGEKVTLRSRMHAGDIPALEALADAVLAE